MNTSTNETMTVKDRIHIFTIPDSVTEIDITPKQRCSRCGHKIGESAVYCEKCGHRVRTAGGNTVNGDHNHGVNPYRNRFSNLTSVRPAGRRPAAEEKKGANFFGIFSAGLILAGVFLPFLSAFGIEASLYELYREIGLALVFISLLIAGFSLQRVDPGAVMLGIVTLIILVYIDKSMPADMTEQFLYSLGRSLTHKSVGYYMILSGGISTILSAIVK